MDMTHLYKIPVSVPDEEVFAAMDAKAALCGVPDEVWSTLRSDGAALLQRYRMSGALVGMYNIDGTFDGKTKPEPGWEHQYPPTVVDSFNRLFHIMHKRSIYITDCEPWWTGATCFIIEDAASLALSLYHTALRNNVLLREWVPEPPKTRKVKAPTVKVHKVNTLYTEWLEHCKAVRDTVTQYKEETQEKVNALWAEAREFERANKAPTFEQYKHDHEG